MKWAYTVKNKMSASIVLLVLCLLVLLSNQLDRMHSENVKNFIATLYEDRLLAEEYILKMTSTVYQVRENLNSELNSPSKNTATLKLLSDFKSTYDAYIKTKLTETERSAALELLEHIQNLEKDYSGTSNNATVHTEKALVSLGKLSAVQLEESKQIMKDAESEYAAIKITSQFASAIVLIILIVLQVLVFSGKTLIRVAKPKDPMLN